MGYTILDNEVECWVLYKALRESLRGEWLYSNNGKLHEIMNGATQLREELLDNDNQNTSHI